jgi:hypothetical protein
MTLCGGQSGAGAGLAITSRSSGPVNQFEPVRSSGGEIGHQTDQRIKVVVRCRLKYNPVFIR